MSNQVHVLPNGTGWNVKDVDGNISYFPLKKTAEERGSFLAAYHKAELVIHGMDGKIQNKNSFGNDPFPPRDTK